MLTNDQLLIEAIRSHNILQAINAIRNGANIYTNNNYAICECILHGNVELSKLLADPENYVYDPEKEERQLDENFYIEYNSDDDLDAFYEESDLDFYIDEELDIDDDYIDNFEFDYPDSDDEDDVSDDEI